MEKIEFQNMIDIAYRGHLKEIKHLQIFGCDAYFEESFSNFKLKVDEESFLNLLQHHFESFKSFEKLSKEKGLGSECYLEARLKGQHVFVPLDYFNKEVGGETREKVENFFNVVLKDFLTLCKDNQITLDDVAYKIEIEIKALKPNTEFSMREIFSKYAKFLWNLDDAISVYKRVLSGLKSKISQLDKFGDKFRRINPDEFNFDVFGDSETN